MRTKSEQGGKPFSPRKPEWEATFTEEFRNLQVERRESLEGKRNAERRRRDRTPQRHTLEQAEAARAAIERRESLNQVVHARLTFGAFWDGDGGVGGNPDYSLPPRRFHGLMSVDSAVLMAFLQRLPRAGLKRKDALLTGKDKAVVGHGDSKLLALDEAYVTGNMLMRGFWRVDADGTFASFEAVRQAVNEAGVVQPQIVVGFVNRKGQVVKPHLIWLIANPVCFTKKGRPAPKSFWWVILRGLVFALQGLGADVGGLSNPMKAKNPLSPWWTVDTFEDEPYQLAELAACVRTNVTAEELGKLKINTEAADEAEAADLLSLSNGLFLALKTYARQAAQARVAIGMTLEEFHAEIALKAIEWAAGADRSEGDAKTVAAKVAEFEWKRVTYMPKSVEEVREAQARSGARTSADRKAKTFRCLLAAYRKLVEDGEEPSQAAVVRASGVSRSTTIRHWPKVMAAVRGSASPTDIAAANDNGSVGGAIRSSNDKKPNPSASGASVMETGRIAFVDFLMVADEPARGSHSTISFSRGISGQETVESFSVSFPADCWAVPNDNGHSPADIRTGTD